MSRPGTVPRSRPSRRATAAAPLRVTAQRVDADEALARPASPGPTPPPAAPPGSGSPSPSVVPAAGPEEVATVVGPAGREGRDPVDPVDLSPVPAPRSSDVLVVRADTAPAPVGARSRSRPGPWTRLAALVTGRRRLAGRHRPGEVPVRGWSMFAPSGRPRGRRRTL